ncbi:heparan-alpha-glucosaminide N-acetyltransferase [Desulfosporosinus meridiei]|uniref:Heparan-alpha-glucosaminide N-acetyltransferase catalytic domain-containing protein n=1 Tax=Desulfosporosinus meridiei (strain ATCC BAA-275 / DSM 13257 / KCTC 12902 / NCIMB 13706 / S10) TaxID=768704 RepID=J7IWE6_DESMD|nr:heparan-alpha-glucosaminide N-acetyltransferase [Desulfosporosinus meridiei]AFQ46060.1 Protein of unknown function (DUF1624) [Desulfosporosinus meridiei DSM 13257]
MTSKQRFGEIDLLRAIAIVLMVIFHLVYDLREFAGVKINYQDPFWFLLGKTSALLFMFLSGLASGFSRSPIRRGVKVLLLGMGITGVTYLALGDMYVRFGILHFLGVTMILAPFLYSLASSILWALAGASVLLGLWFKKVLVETSLLIPFGLLYKGFGSIDYYPLLPYGSATFLGILAYRHFYAQESEPVFALQLNSKPIIWLSRNSLMIYLVHQPIILFVIFGFKFIR